MIARIWHGWTTEENAPRYEAVVRGEVIPGIEARAIPGFRSIELMRRPVDDGVEFATIMWFDDLESVKAFMGDDYDVAHVPPAAQAVLSRFDPRSQHYEILEPPRPAGDLSGDGDHRDAGRAPGSRFLPVRIGFA